MIRIQLCKSLLDYNLQFTIFHPIKITVFCGGIHDAGIIKLQPA